MPGEHRGDGGEDGDEYDEHDHAEADHRDPVVAQPHPGECPWAASLDGPYSGLLQCGCFGWRLKTHPVPPAGWMTVSVIWGFASDRSSPSSSGNRHAVAWPAGSSS